MSVLKFSMYGYAFVREFLILNYFTHSCFISYVIQKTLSFFHQRDKTINRFNLSIIPRDKTNKVTVRPAKTQVRLIRVFACAQWIAKDPSFLHADSEDSDQIGWMPRLI